LVSTHQLQEWFDYNFMKNGEKGTRKKGLPALFRKKHCSFPARPREVAALLGIYAGFANERGNPKTARVSILVYQSAGS
jgi:hypothetical protein